MSKAKKNLRATKAFTLVEMLLAVGLIVLLASLIYPAIGDMMDRAHRTSCASNLRQIATAVQQVAQDNGNVFPKIEGNPDDPVYPPEIGAKSLREVLEPYGFKPQNLRCNADIRRNNHFAKTGSSYEWFTLVDDEVTSAPKIYLSSGVLMLPPSKLPMAADYDSVHNGLKNVLFVDGHVQAY